MSDIQTDYQEAVASKMVGSIQVCVEFPSIITDGDVTVTSLGSKVIQLAKKFPLANEFLDFLINNSVPYEAEPYCSQPDRISGQLIKDLSEPELACPPQVSPTSTYQEIIQVSGVLSVSPQSLCCRVRT